ncbi:MAG: acyl-CoA dehydrogenase, partial [Betaproteobacteria bacterium]
MLTFFITVFVALAIIWALAYHSASALIWSVVVGAGLVVGSVTGAIGGVLAGMVWLAFIAFAVIANSKALRLALLSSPMFSTYKKLLPQMSSTEQEALEAGTVWWDGDLFSGRPDWNKWLAVPRATLSAEEQAFVDGPTNELCSMLDEWNITH